MKKTIIASLFLFLFMACSHGAFAGENQPGERADGRQGPPPEAYSACEGKNAGDQAELTAPDGAIVTGVCEMEGDRLVLRPDHPRGRPQGSGEEGMRGARRHGPPPEAYAACEGKNAGDQAELTAPDGAIVSGVCEMEGERLVLRPDNPRGGPRGSGEESMRGEPVAARRHGPPPEAYAACEGKNAGDRVEFTGPNGVNVSGTCEMRGEKLVLIPARP